LAACAKENKLSGEDFYAKGIRVAKPELFFSSFGNPQQQIEIELQTTDNLTISSNLVFDKSAWRDTTLPDTKAAIAENELIQQLTKLRTLEANEWYQNLKSFIIYTASTLSLRGLHAESRKEPLGINGEGLDTEISRFNETELTTLKQYNYLISWLDDFTVDIDDRLKFDGFKPNKSTSKLYFTDKFMRATNNFFSSENANEGMLHILFYLALFISPRTPKFFAIDNIESSLNPHLCRELMTIVCDLAKNHHKQVLITTHNPAILDGLNLFDDAVRLFEVSRTDEGHTRTRRIKLKPEHEQQEGRRLKLSDLWTRGYLGAISQNY